MDHGAGHPVQVTRGTCHVLVALDVGLSLDLAALATTGTGQRRSLRERGSALEYFAYRPAPLWLAAEQPPVTVGRWQSETRVGVTAYDFGAVSVTFGIPCAGTITDLIVLSEALGNVAAFEAAARRVVETLLEQWGGAVREPRIGGTVETYLLFHLAAVEPRLPPAALWTSHATDIARVLRSESGQLSAEEVVDATAAHLAYGTDDGTVVDWNAAVAYAPDVEDIRTVTDFANVQLLEMRHLDHELDQALDRSYALVSRRLGWVAALSGQRAAARRVAQMQVDAAVLFERVSSVLKIFGEQYLARAYRHLADRFRLREWDATIQRKLQTIEGIYDKLSDEAAERRLELLEWIIVLLIAFEILWSFIG